MPTHGDLPDTHATARGRGRYFNAIALLALAIVAAVLLAVFGSDVLYDAAVAITTFMDTGPSFPQWIVYVFVGSFPVVLLHELGHAIVARRLLKTPVSIAIGSTGKLGQLRLGEISLTLNAIGSITGTAGLATYDASRAGARDILLIALAGPIISAAGLLVSIAALASAPTDGVIHDLVWATVGVGVAAVMNLIPFEYKDRKNGPTYHSDGRLALDAARTLRALRA